jgi:capsular polysaccharide biosynthesis protein
MQLSETSEFDFPKFENFCVLADDRPAFGQVQLSGAETIEFGSTLPETSRKRLVEQVFPIPPSHRSITRRAVHAFRSTDAFYLPQYGTLITSNGSVLQESFAEARWITPTKASLPFTRVEDGIAHFEPPSTLPEFESGFVCVPLGATVNYGHFLLDCLPAIVGCCEFLRRGRIPLLMPSLNSWQKRHLELLDLDLEMIEIASPAVLCKTVYHTSIMNHFIHYLTPLINEVARRQLRAISPGVTAGGFGNRIFIERADQVSRKFPGERALIEALSAYGFRAVRTEMLSVDDEIAVLAAADIVIGPIGAGFANAVYCKEGSLIIDIIPSSMQGDIWVRNICSVRSCFWIQIVIPSRPPANIIHNEGEARPNIGMEYDPEYDVEQVVNMLRPLL